MNKKLLQQAQQYYQQGDLINALKSYQQLAEENPEDADLQHNVGILQAQTKHYQQALQSINQAIKINPNNAAFYNSKGNILVRLKKFNDAILQYQQAIKIQPNYAIAYNSLGRIFYQQEQLVEAEKNYEKALKLQPEATDTLYNYGVLLSKAGQYEKALKYLNQVLQITPQHAYAIGQIAQVYLQLQDYPRAIEYLHQRLQLQPSHVESYYDLGLAYLENNEPDLAIACFEKNLQSTEADLECNHFLANAYLQIGDRAKALTYYFRQLEIKPLLATYYNIGVLLMYEERHQEALEYLKMAEKLAPAHLPTQLNIGSLYLKLQAPQQALKYYQKAARLKPDDLEIKYILTALKQKETPVKAPTEYLQHLFDQYAQYYDVHLTQYLHYQVPKQIYEMIITEVNLDNPQWQILDIGCGTGLCGELFRKDAKKLIGIDISKEMIEVAKKKKIYDELKIADIETALPLYQNMDLIIAADVFTYIGDLQTIFQNASHSLVAGGLFIFSAEKSNQYPYKLQQSMRYAHHKKYLEELIAHNHFQCLRFDNIILRKQQKEPVEGYLVLCKKCSVIPARS